MDSVRWFSVNKVDEEQNTAQFQQKKHKRFRGIDMTVR